MNERSDCPSAEHLDRFLRGELEKPERERITAHLHDCTACAEKVQSLRTRTLDAQNGIFVSRPTPLGGNEPTTAPFSVEMPSDVSAFELLDPPQDAKAIGRIGKYDIFGLLGQGGYGVVFRGFDEQLRRPIAIKVLSPELAASERARRRFIREARAAACINHPNVVTIHAVEEHHGTPFLVMEYVGGGSLRDRIRTGAKLGPIDLVRITAQIATGLAAAHAQGVIHRDIKPGNVMLENGIERLKITDFGLARVALDNVDLTSREMAVGTPAYMSPEQVAGAEVDGRADLFALGCVIHAMVTGHSPFHGRTALEIARHVQDDHPPVLHEIDKSVPRFLSEIAEKLLKKAPDERIQSAAEVAATLSRYLAILNQTPTDKLPLALSESLAMDGPSPKRWPLSGRLAACVAAAAALVAFAVFAWRAFHPAPFQAPESNGPLGNMPLTAAALDSTPAKPSRVTVSQSGEADCTTLAAALDRIGPGDVIEILDDAVYDESLLIDSEARWRGVRMAAPRGATLRSAASDPLLTIRGVSGFVVDGLRLHARGEQRGIVVEGNCPGVRLENLEVRRLPNHSSVEQWAAVHIDSGAEGAAGRPIVVRGVKIHDTAVGIVLGFGIDPAPVRWVNVEECLVTGQSGDVVLLTMFPGVEQVQITRSIFTGGECAVSVVADHKAPFRDVRFSNNTVHACVSWIKWEGADAPSQEISFRANLLLDVQDTFVPARTSTDSHKFSFNVWRATPLTNRGNANRVALVVEQLALESESREAADFLKPKLNELRKLVGDGAPLPGHVGQEPP